MSSPITAIALQLIITNKSDEVKGLVARGFCPVECSIGGESIIDALAMDHHGAESHREGVAIRAYRDHFGARRADPRFVVVGAADADACFAIASLAGLLPHPSRVSEFEGKPSFVVKAMTADLTSLAATVNLIDTNPIGLDISQLPFGDMLSTWNAMTPANKDSLGLYTGVGMWVNLTTGNPRQLATFLAAAKASEEARVVEAKADLDESAERISDSVLFLNGSRAWGFDIWDGRELERGTSDEVKGWNAPIVVAYLESNRNVTVGCPNNAVAEAILGKGGLKNAFPVLDEIVSGWGGRESIGGSPRGMELTEEQAREAASKIAELVKNS